MTTVTLTRYSVQTTWPPSSDGTINNYTLTLMASKIIDNVAKTYGVDFNRPITPANYATEFQRKLLDLKNIQHTLTIQGFIDASSSNRTGSDTAQEALVDFINLVKSGGWCLLKWEGIYQSASPGIYDSAYPSGNADGIWVNFSKFNAEENPSDETTPTKYKIIIEVIHSRRV